MNCHLVNLVKKISRGQRLALRRLIRRRRRSIEDSCDDRRNVQRVGRHRQVQRRVPSADNLLKRKVLNIDDDHWLQLHEKLQYPKCSKIEYKIIRVPEITNLLIL